MKYLDLYFAAWCGRLVGLPQHRVAQELWENFCLATYILYFCDKKKANLLPGNCTGRPTGEIYRAT
jgi:hypothetical protein